MRVLKANDPQQTLRKNQIRRHQTENKSSIRIHYTRTESTNAPDQTTENQRLETRTSGFYQEQSIEEFSPHEKAIKTERNFSLNKKEKSLRILQDINGRKNMGPKGRNTCFGGFSMNHKSDNLKVDSIQDFNQQVTPLVENLGSPTGEYGMDSLSGSGLHKTYAKYNDKWNTIFEEMSSVRFIENGDKPGRRGSK
jgi:hypothetical protein